MSPAGANGEPQGPGPRPLREWIPMVYDKACDRAHHLLAKWTGVNRPGTRSLVHQAFRRLSECGVEWCESREHALALLVQKMRWELVDLARRIDSGKRGGRGHDGRGKPVFHRQLISAEVAARQGWEPSDFLALDEALVRLQSCSRRHAQVVELLFLLDLSPQEVADELGVSRATVYNDWQLAKAWLLNELGETGTADDASTVRQ